MSKRLVLVLLVLCAVAIAVPAFAAVQNVKVSGDILARYIARNEFDLTKDGSTGDDKISVFNTVTRLRVDADLTDNVSTVVRLINERNWTEADPATTDIDIDLAYVTMKEFLYSPLTLTIGRQELHFGNDMIIGDGVGTPRPGAVSGGIGTNQTTNYVEGAGWGGVNGDLSLRKSFDAIKATLNYDPLVIDMVYAKIRANVITQANGAGTTNDDMDLYGINAGYKFSDKWNSMAEGYFWSKINNGTTGSSNPYTEGKGDDVQVVGARVSTNPTKKLNLQQEFAYQFGKRVGPPGTASAGLARDRSAFAAQSIAMLTPGWKYNPTMGLIYSYFSGDSNRDVTVDPSKKYHAWDPMFENQTAGSIINALYPSSNSHNIDMMTKLTPMEDITLRADYVIQLMARGGFATGALSLNDYEPSGGNTYNKDKQFVGQELDVNLMYDYTEDVQFGLLMGWFWPGSALTKTPAGLDNRSTASEAIASCKVSF